MDIDDSLPAPIDNFKFLGSHALVGHRVNCLAGRLESYCQLLVDKALRRVLRGGKDVCLDRLHAGNRA
jgi:hypothetical protein